MKALRWLASIAVAGHRVLADLRSCDFAVRGGSAKARGRGANGRREQNVEDLAADGPVAIATAQRGRSAASADAIPERSTSSTSSASISR